MTDVVIEIPMMPPRECSPNWHGHWANKARAVAEFRQQARMSAMVADNTEAWIGFDGPVTLDVEIAWCCGRKRLDDDNAKASLKAAIDGISDALWSGQDRHVTIGTVLQKRGKGVVRVMMRGSEV